MSSASSSWGLETKYFYDLTPENVLDSVESLGFILTGRVQALGSFENRVYDVELEEGQEYKSLIAKFYRPGRWNKEQILEEHAFLLQLKEAEIPVVYPIPFQERTQNKITLQFHSSTLAQLPNGIFVGLFPKVGGRPPDEMNEDQLEWVGRLLARIHQIGKTKTAPSRVILNAENYGQSNLDYLLAQNCIPTEFRNRYQDLASNIISKSGKLLSQFPIQRIHGDCHFNNLLWGLKGPIFLDFDDMVQGPCVQDLWLLLQDRSELRLDSLVSGYEEIFNFDRKSLILIEPLRALRFIHYTGWVARRYEDPAFPQAFPHFGTDRYWQQETLDLEKQWELIQKL